MHLNVQRQDKRWDYQDAALNHWLYDRQQLIQAQNNLIKLRPFKEKVWFEDELDALLTLLVDYISEGQFKILETIAQAAELNPDVHLDKEIVYKILQTNNDGVDFYEKYHNATSFTSLENDLSKLSEILANRFEWEDMLIEVYIQATTELRL